MLNANRIEKRISKREAAQFRNRRNSIIFALELGDIEPPPRDSIYGPMRVAFAASTGTWEVR